MIDKWCVTCQLLPAGTADLRFELASSLLHLTYKLVNFPSTCHFKCQCQAALQSVLTLVRQIEGFTVSESQIPFSLSSPLPIWGHLTPSPSLQPCSPGGHIGCQVFFFWAVSIFLLHSAWWMASRLMPGWPLAPRVRLCSMRNLKASLGYSEPLHNAAPKHDLWGNFHPRAAHIWLSKAYCLF